ncbi:PREDICTED: trafficking kinesin-binding protein 1-like [Priapulus caudatus]|uniref:Trafficking kinesin-binding protein 1-like n=1 Tax=Priapulus caudatus TaxID=37621 RepID=A0ABM1DW81_PRICU|nr:PREDICTED: trafficking kinesin-binding protein 1-like [Priapulus caudatus]
MFGFLLAQSLLGLLATLDLGKVAGDVFACEKGTLFVVFTCSSVMVTFMTWFVPSNKLASNALNNPTTSKEDGKELDESDLENESVNIQCKEASTLTDLCYTANVPEVEIISLIEEQIPKYTLRADTITNFQGYTHEDWWVSTPVLPPDYEVELSPELTDETLKYFALCGERLSQMTKTYDDINAVTHLLAEKEKDLELAAKIGQSLLERNRHLQQKHEQSEEQVNIAQEKISQLRHELSMKNSLLEVYVQDLDYSEYSDDAANDTFDQRCGASLQHITVLQCKVDHLQQENVTLKEMTCSIRDGTAEAEAQEKVLVTDCVKQLVETNHEVNQLATELSRKTEDNYKQQEEITHLLTQICELQKKCKKLSVESYDAQETLAASKASQHQLTAELMELQGRFQECMAMLQELQAETRRTRHGSHPSARRTPYAIVSPFLPPDSLACELDASLRSDCQPGYSPGESREHVRKVMETSRAARHTHRSHSASRKSSRPASAHDASGRACGGGGGGGSVNDSLDCASVVSENYMGDTEDSRTESPFSSSPYLGKAGVPGSNDLETALRRLSLRRANEINQQQFRADDRRRHEEEEEEVEVEVGGEMDASATPNQCWTPESYMSHGSDASRMAALYGYKSFYPEKLQIVKPMEGELIVIRVGV